MSLSIVSAEIFFPKIKLSQILSVGVMRFNCIHSSKVYFGYVNIAAQFALRIALYTCNTACSITPDKHNLENIFS